MYEKILKTKRINENLVTVRGGSLSGGLPDRTRPPPWTCRYLVIFIFQLGHLLLVLPDSWNVCGSVIVFQRKLFQLPSIVDVGNIAVLFIIFVFQVRSDFSVDGHDLS